MFGECHAHMIMDGVNYKKAVAQHKDGVVDAVIRQRFEEYTKRGIFFIRDGGDACGVSKRAAQLACEYGITYRTPIFALPMRWPLPARPEYLHRNTAPEYPPGENFR